MADNDLSNALSSLFSDPESMNKLQGLIGMLSGGNGGQTAPPPQAAESPEPMQQPMAQAAPPEPSGGGLPFDPGMLVKLQQAMSMIRQDDPRIAFLVALKPNLSEHRRQRVDEAVRLLRMVHLVPFLREQHFL